ncbi:MAG: phytoene desaturase [Pseudomonadales bacterium]
MTQHTAAVIGSGFGGLALAIRLQSAGFRTTIFEGRDKPGGRAYVYEDQGFTFDAGPTVITDPDCLRELFALTGRRLEDYVELLPVRPFYRLCWEDGYVFDYSNDVEENNRQIQAKNPEDVEGYRRFLAYSEEVLKEGYIKLGTAPFLNFSDMIRAAPQLVRLQSYRSVYSMVSKFIKDDHLRQAFSFHTLLVGGNPFNTSSIYTLIHSLEKRWGVSFPKGGTHALVRGLVKLFEDIGGEIRLSSPVAEILTEGDRVTGVRTEAGFEGRYDAVASNADVVFTYEKLLGRTPRGRQAARAMKRRSFSPSLFVTYFGVEGTYPELRHHSILFGPRYRALLKEIYKGPGLADDFSLYLHAPTVTDPGLAPAGCSTFYALSPVPNLEKANLDWEALAPAYSDRILDYLERHYLPGLRSRIVTQRTFTPFDFRDELNAHLGSAFSLEPVLWQSAYFRTHNRDDRLQGLYFAGAGTHPGAGIPGVVGSGKATATLMLQDFGRRYSDADVSHRFAKA